jgi:hypothetical protein
VLAKGGHMRAMHVLPPLGAVLVSLYVICEVTVRQGASLDAILEPVAPHILVFVVVWILRCLYLR